MPKPSKKNGLKTKKPQQSPAPPAETQLVDLDDVNEGGVSDTLHGTPNSQHRNTPKPPFVEPEDEDAFTQPQSQLLFAATAQQSDYPALVDDPFGQVDTIEDDDDAVPAIPIPVPRSQTPQHLVSVSEEPYHTLPSTFPAPRRTSLAQPVNYESMGLTSYVEPEANQDLVSSPPQEPRSSPELHHAMPPPLVLPVHKPDLGYESISPTRYVKPEVIQTPVLSPPQEPEYDTHHVVSPPPVQPLHLNKPNAGFQSPRLPTSPKAEQVFSYGYGHQRAASSSSSVTQTPSPSFPPSSPAGRSSPASSRGTSRTPSSLARTIQAPHTPTSSSSKRFTVPLPFTRLEESKASAPAPAVTLDFGIEDTQEAELGIDSGLRKIGNTSTSGHPTESVSWARWDEAFDPTRKTTRLRFLIVSMTAPALLRVWDASDLGELVEVLNIPASSLVSGKDKPGTLVHGAVLPRCPRKKGVDDGVLLGLAFDTGLFVVYSLTSHQVMTRFNIPSRSEGSHGAIGIRTRATKVVNFVASDEFIVISTTSPEPALHILDAATFAPLTVIPSERLALYAPPPLMQPLDATAIGVVSSAGASAKAMLSTAWATSGLHLQSPSKDTTNTSPQHNARRHQRHTSLSATGHVSSLNTSLPLPSPPQPHHPYPVYALSHRLLAFISPSPKELSPHSPSKLSPSTPLSSTQTQADMLLRLGGTVWGGMRVLGGKAVEAARNRIDAGGTSGPVGRFFSRSAPERERVQVQQERDGPDSSSSSSGLVSLPAEGVGGGGGCIVTVVDLKALISGGSKSGAGAMDKVVVEFKAGDESKPVSGLAFSHDGCSLAVIPKDGHTVKVYSIRPPLRGLRPSSSGRSSASIGAGVVDREGGAAWHMYNLRRGRTSVVVEGVEWSKDGRWVAVVSRNRTVHVFGVNPYGGKTDVRSHLEGRVRSVDSPQAMPLDLAPIVRLRTAVAPSPEQMHVPLAFTFINSSEPFLPSHFAPPHIAASPPTHTRPTPRSYGTDNTGPPSPISPTHHPRGRATNFQDALLYDPVDASLTLRRMTLDKRIMKDHGIAFVTGALGVSGNGGGGITSISLPGMGFSGSGSVALSSSPSKGGVGPFGSRGTAQPTLQEVETELVGRESTVMSWNLRITEGGGEIRKAVGAAGVSVGQGASGKAEHNWLAQAELSTFSKTYRSHPKPIYLSHQFSFYSLGEDYHALIRRYQLDIGGLKVDVRREVQISAYPTSRGDGESFVEGFASPREIQHRTISSSFDEPLASALSNEIEHPHTSGVLPMLPNGTPGSHPQSLRNAIPIRTIGDGMSESLGRLRREINKVRSPMLRPRPDSSMSTSVPLEFDEEDEDFLARDQLEAPPRRSSRSTSRGRDRDSELTVSTPATSTHVEEDRALDTAEDTWGGWSTRDKMAVEEVERYDNIDVLGLLDEEQVTATQVKEEKGKGRGRRRG